MSRKKPPCEHHGECCQARKRRGWTPSVCSTFSDSWYKGDTTEFDAERYRKAYGLDLNRVGFIEELRFDASRAAEWPGAVTITKPDGKKYSFPRPFRSGSERREFCNRFGFGY